MSIADGLPARAYVHPATGELLGLDRDTDELASDYAELQDVKRNADLALRKLDAELQSRLHGERRLIANGWEIRPSRRRVWDGDELWGVLEDLYDRGMIPAREVPDIVRREVKVSGTNALRLADRLDLAERTEINRCFSWATGRVEVTPTTEDR